MGRYILAPLLAGAGAAAGCVNLATADSRRASGVAASTAANRVGQVPTVAAQAEASRANCLDSDATTNASGPPSHRRRAVFSSAEPSPSLLSRIATSLFGPRGTGQQQEHAPPLATDKLRCNLPLRGAESSSPSATGAASSSGMMAADGSGAAYRPVVLVSCGSFNPPTIMHLRMFELAAQELRKRGYDVLGGYMSPVHGGYGKPDLAPAEHRCAMAQAAAATSPFIMVDRWEASQPRYQRSLSVLQRIQAELETAFGDEQDANPLSPPPPHPSTTSAAAVQQRQQQQQGRYEKEEERGLPTAPRAQGGSASGGDTGGPGQQRQQRVGLRVMLLCGGDLLESMALPGVWLEPQLRQLLGEHGVVAIAREGSAASSLLERPGSVLHEFRGNVVVVPEPVANSISSTLLRQELQKGHSVRYLTPDAVIDYIREHGLYKDDG